MAGTLELSQDLCWMPAGWIYDNALEGIANIIGKSEPELQQRLLASLTDVNGGYLDLQQCDAGMLTMIETALASVIANAVSAGPNAMHDPSFYDGYVQQLREFHALLKKRLNELVGIE